MMERFARHLLHRLRRSHIRQVMDLARRGGLAEKSAVFVDGLAVHRFHLSPGTALLNGDPLRDSFLVRQLLNGKPDLAMLAADINNADDLADGATTVVSDGLTAAGPTGFEDTAVDEAVVSGRRSDQAALAALDRTPAKGLSAIEANCYLLHILRSTAATPAAAELAVVFLLARAVVTCGLPYAETLRRLSRTAPIVIVRTPVAGFARRLIDMISEDQILPGKSLVDGLMGGVRYRSRLSGGQFIMSIFDEDLESIDDDVIERKVAAVIDAGQSALVVCDKTAAVPQRLTAAADLELDTGPLDWPIIARVLGRATSPCRGDRVETVPAQFHLKSLDDLTLAVRPSRSRDETLELLKKLAEVRREAEGNWPGAGAKKKSRAGNNSSSGGGRRGKDQGSGSTIIQPVTDTCAGGAAVSPEASGSPSAVNDAGEGDDVLVVATSAASESAEGTDPISAADVPGYKASLRVETLAGYGEARDWALDLKSDVDRWRDGQIAWSDMNTRFLLSGPPGTGKTIFARALCNSLGVPLLATSVSTWLQLGYLNDVLNRITAAFAEAKEFGPCILFIDECDGIGRRRGSEREYADYWNAIINKLLELLDGAVKTEGVIIIGATNLPEMIDEAITRSGRLERHIPIPRPDIDALLQIFAHHLGPDLPAIVRQEEFRRAAASSTEQGGGND